MKTSSEMRLECLRMASALGSSKTIQPGQVVAFAMEFFRWVDGQDDTKPGLTARDLADKFK
jgi:hypothetical protein